MHGMKIGYFLAWQSFRIFFKLYFRWEVYGTENVPKKGPVLIASNHASYLDPPLVGSSLKRDMHYLARDTLFLNPVAGKILRYVNAVPVDRDGSGISGMRNIMEQLNQEHGVILFPEGTRSKDGHLQPGKTGVSLIVIRCPVPVVPVRVLGSFEAYGRGQKFPHPHKVLIRFGKPLDFSKLRQEALECPKPRQREIYREISDTIMKKIEELGTADH